MPQYFIFLLKKLNFWCGNYTRAETNQGRKLLIIRGFWPWKLFKGGNYSRAETIRGNAVDPIRFKQPKNKTYRISSWGVDLGSNLKSSLSHNSVVKNTKPTEQISRKGSETSETLAVAALPGHKNSHEKWQLFFVPIHK